MFYRIKWSCGIFLFCLLFFMAMRPSSAGILSDPQKNAQKLADKICFLPADSSVSPIFNGKMTMEFMGPLYRLNYLSGKSDKDIGNYEDYFGAKDGVVFFNGYWFVHVTGVAVRFKNVSDQVLIIRWRESTINVYSFSGIPFLDGMFYSDMNSVATPDTVIAPGQVIRKDLYLPIFYHDCYCYGTPIPKNKPVLLNFVLKIYDEDDNSKYSKVNCPPISIQ